MDWATERGRGWGKAMEKVRGRVTEWGLGREMERVSGWGRERAGLSC
jgi:hypothetical protein